jgi:hypothetical protein
MPEYQVKRGRPKGTGIDDHSRLQQIAALMAADPSLKATTAIKSLGITDPSVIRRLRDKFHAFQAGTGAEIAAHAASQAAARTRPKVVAARNRGSAVKSTPVAGAPPPEPAKAPEHKAAPDPDQPTAWLDAWCGMGLRAMASAVEAQVALTQELLRAPAFTMAVRQQIALSDIAIGLCKGAGRSAVH